jgi:hypothetical protein
VCERACPHADTPVRLAFHARSPATESRADSVSLRQTVTAAACSIDRREMSPKYSPPLVLLTSPEHASAHL